MQVHSVYELVIARDFSHGFQHVLLQFFVAGLFLHSIILAHHALGISVVLSADSTDRAHLVKLTLVLEFFVGQNSLLSNAVSNENLQKMVGHLIELLNLFNVSTNDSLLVLEHSDSSVNLHVHVRFVIEVFESNRDFILTLLVKNDFESS